MPSHSLFALLLTGCFTGALAQADVTLVQDGAPAVTIVVPAAAEPRETFAAERLQLYIARISGAKLPIVSDANAVEGPAVHVGLTKGCEETLSRLQARGTSPEACAVSADGQTVRILGISPIGTLHAAYFLLEELGCRWYLPTPWGTVVPAKQTLAVTSGERYRAPSFAIRTGLSTIGAQEDKSEEWAPNEWGRGSHMGGWGWWGSGHSYQYLVDFSEYKDHPEWFAYYGGERHPTQLCTTNPEVRHKALQTVLDVLSKPDPPELICVSPCDGQGFCECDDCRKLIPPEGGSIDRIVEFANFIADSIRDKYPGHYVTYYCDYHSVGTPTLVKPAKNTVFWITQWAQDQFHGVSPETPMGKSLERWSKFGNPIYLYTYYGSYGSWTFWPQVHAIAKDLPYYKQHGAIGVYSETHQHWGTQHLNFIVFSRLAWDADADVPRIVGEFCREFYGPAAEPMRRYYELLETTAEKGPAQYHLHSDIIAIFTPEVLAQLRECIDQAQQAVAQADAVYRQRMDFVSAGFRQADLYIGANHLKADYGRTKDPAIRERMVSMYREALDIITAPPYAGRLVENWLIEDTFRRELGVLENSTSFVLGKFAYGDYLTRGGNTAMDAALRTGFIDGTWGLDLDKDASGELVYELRAKEGVFGEARLSQLVYGGGLVGTRIEVADSLDGPWTTVAAHEQPTQQQPSGVPLPVELPQARGKDHLFVKIALQNRHGAYVCALCNVGFEGEVVQR